MFVVFWLTLRKQRGRTLNNPIFTKALLANDELIKKKNCIVFHKTISNYKILIQIQIQHFKTISQFI